MEYSILGKKGVVIQRRELSVNGRCREGGRVKVNYKSERNFCLFKHQYGAYLLGTSLSTSCKLIDLFPLTSHCSKEMEVHRG